MIPIPPPTNEIHKIGEFRHAGKYSIYFWVQGRRVIVQKPDLTWWLTQDTKPITLFSSIFQTPPQTIQIMDFHLYENYADITQPNDLLNFHDANWSDFAFDNLFVSGYIHIQENQDNQASPPGSE